jgi:uncharacterized membrane protein YkvA (DUF1232 family)
VASGASIAIGVVAGLLVAYLAAAGLLLVYARRRRDVVSMREALRLLPDVLRLIRRLAADPTLPRGVHIRLILLIAYLASPIDLVPDFVPVIGYADDALIVALVLRSVVRSAGPHALDSHWPGTPEGLVVVRRLAGIAEQG